MTKKGLTSKGISVADYIVGRIAALGIDRVFLVQGGAIMKVIDAVGRHPTLSFTAANHEQAVAIMTDAYARIKGFGVGMATSGPGGINLATGIACAYYDSIPCLFITGQVGMFHVKSNRRVRQRGFQETDIVSIVKPITKYAVMLEKAEDARRIFEEAVWRAKEGRPGPVLIDIPYNIQREIINPRTLKGFVPLKQKSAHLTEQVYVVYAELQRATRPLILVGGGVRLSEQSEIIRALVHETHIPVVTTWGALDVFPYNDALYLGNVGRAGNPSAVEAVQRADIVLALGTRFTTKIIIADSGFAKQARVLAVDSDEGELNDGLFQPALKIIADLREFVPALRTALRGHTPSVSPEWKNELRGLKAERFAVDATRKETEKTHVSPYLLGRIISAILGTNDIFAVDCGFNLTWMTQSFLGKGGEQRFISAWGCSPMGYALPASSGAWYARPEALVACVIGDGGAQMNIQELQTIVVNKIPVKIFVLNNHSYATLRFPTRKEFDGRTFATEPSTGYASPDFVAIARAYGLPAVRLLNNRNLAMKVRAILKRKGPVIVEVNTDPEQGIFETMKFS